MLYLSLLFVTCLLLCWQFSPLHSDSEMQPRRTIKASGHTVLMLATVIRHPLYRMPGCVAHIEDLPQPVLEPVHVVPATVVCGGRQNLWVIFIGAVGRFE